ncbi:hypothetical protein KPL47_19275 [Clostridium estertheticum]|uniref:hypothetical protein n=1 Tax=Clostridium estertheticum TaxID=238834 RepID=UPI001C0ADE89|nr:hypothetical protein [Clostridium estertheticum]MBU3178467.1 hypothetical protein [Clostridium estertheticum]
MANDWLTLDANLALDASLTLGAILELLFSCFKIENVEINTVPIINPIIKDFFSYKKFLLI